ncbi:MAG TPA: hypothetical protein VML19_10015 [Verrucomicrobiae bacterium]|nr:hypothetical protein [Verrucomicrobiae bacterium]
MDWLEDQLKQALDRKMPSADFAERVAAAAQPTGPIPRSAVRPWFLPRSWFVPRSWMTAAAAVALIIGGAAEYRQYRGRQAKERVLLALRITSGRLNQIQSRALRVSRRESHEAAQ